MRCTLASLMGMQRPPASRLRVLEQVVVVWNGLSMPIELGYFDDFYEHRSRCASRSPYSASTPRSFTNVDGSWLGRPGIPVQRRLSCHHAGHERYGCGELESFTARQVDILDAGGGCDGSILIRPTHIGQGTHDNESCLEDTTVMQFNLNGGRFFVSDLESPFGKGRYLLGGSSGVRDSLLHCVVRFHVIGAANDDFKPIFKDGIVGAVPVFVSLCGGALDQGTGGAGQKGSRSPGALLKIRSE